MSQKRKRSQNFTAEEKHRLVKLLYSHKDTILNKKTDGSTNESKYKAWIEVTNAFNEAATVYRSKKSLTKVWEKLKTESKLYYQSNRQSVSRTGGGPVEVKADPILEQVCTLLGQDIIGVQDCDIIIEDVEDTPPKKISTGVESTINFPVMEEIGEPSNYETPHEFQNYTISESHLSSRRSPQIAQTNERTSAVYSLYDSLKTVNKKKEDTEDLKKQLLQDEVVFKRKLQQEELDFKRKLHQLQLEAAKREIEIKTEVLNQLKGGTINMQQLFGGPKDK